jgi:membrane protein
VTKIFPFLKFFLILLRDTVREFSADKAFRHGAAISYYTIFSLPAILIIVIRVAGYFFGEDTVRVELLVQIEQLIGADSANEVGLMIENIRPDRDSWWATLLGIGTLLFGATGVFYTLQDSINTIWKLNTHFKRKNVFKLVFDRLISFAMVLSLGFILLVSMVLETIIVAVNVWVRSMGDSFHHLTANWAPWALNYVDQIDLVFFAALGANIVLSLIVITLMFSLIFKLLPAARLPWRDVLLGAFFTAVLFIIGELLIGWYIGNSNIGSTYGAAGSIVVILLWVFYSANILLLGAEFVQVYLRMKGREIQPSPLAISIADQPLRRLRIRMKSMERPRLQRKQNAQAVIPDPEPEEPSSPES